MIPGPPGIERILAIGTTAHGALIRAGGKARVLARLTAATYCVAGDDIVWLGGAAAPRHPRAVLFAGGVTVEGDEVRLPVDGLVPWCPGGFVLDCPAAATLASGWRLLIGDLGTLGTADGFGRLLTGAPLRFPLDGARRAADGLAAACARDDAAAATEAALDLLGLGAGLTPSGDDYVGGALFGRRLLADAGLADARAWRSAATAVLAAAPARTNPISVALLGDLAAGQAHAPLHDLVGALAGGARGEALDSARRLIRIGHSSGWDMLAGLGAGLGRA